MFVRLIDAIECPMIKRSYVIFAHDADVYASLFYCAELNSDSFIDVFK